MAAPTPCPGLQQSIASSIASSIAQAPGAACALGLPTPTHRSALDPLPSLVDGGHKMDAMLTWAWCAYSAPVRTPTKSPPPAEHPTRQSFGTCNLAVSQLQHTRRNTAVFCISCDCCTSPYFSSKSRKRSPRQLRVPCIDHHMHGIYLTTALFYTPHPKLKQLCQRHVQLNVSVQYRALL